MDLLSATSKISKRIATNHWVATVLILRELLALIGWAVALAWPNSHIITQYLPTMADIDWMDFSGKLIIMVVIIMLQRVVKGMKAEQDKWRKQNSIQALLNSARMYTLHFRIGKAEHDFDQTHQDAKYAKWTLDEWNMVAKMVVEEGIYKDQKEADAALTEMYMLNKEFIEKKVNEYEAYIRGLGDALNAKGTSSSKDAQ